MSEKECMSNLLWREAILAIAKPTVKEFRKSRKVNLPLKQVDHKLKNPSQLDTALQDGLQIWARPALLIFGIKLIKYV